VTLALPRTRALAVHVVHVDGTRSVSLCIKSYRLKYPTFDTNFSAEAAGMLVTEAGHNGGISGVLDHADWYLPQGTYVFEATRSIAHNPLAFPQGRLHPHCRGARFDMVPDPPQAAPPPPAECEVPFASEPVHAAWPTLDRLQRISWFWSSVNANIIERFARIPAANRLLVRIEDLTQDTMPPVLSFCGLPQNYAPEALAPDNASSGPTVEWTSDNVRKFNELAGFMMVSLGYALR